MPTYRQDIKATTGNSPVNQVAGAASSFNPDQSMAAYVAQQGGDGGSFAGSMLDSMRSYKQQKKQALNASKGVGVLSGAAAMRSSQAAGAVPGSGGDISELSDRVSALEGGQASAQPNGQGAMADVASAVFPNAAQNAAQGMFGTEDQRQQTVAQQPI